MRQRPQKREPSAPGRGGQQAAASRRPLHYAQGGLHSLTPSAPYPFPVGHLTFSIFKLDREILFREQERARRGYQQARPRDAERA
jgi:hypothetical protein